MTDEPVLEMRGITKKFPGIVANDDGRLDVRQGRGARPARRERRGQVDADEHPLRALQGGRRRDSSARQARRVHLCEGRDPAGIGMVHQHFMLIPVMTVAENIVLGNEPARDGVLLDERGAEDACGSCRSNTASRSTPGRSIADITVGQQQRVEILKALYRGAEVLILDEPTAVLTPQEAAELFEHRPQAPADGKSIIFITHKLNEVLEIADRITVLRRGKKVETVPAKARPRSRSRERWSAATCFFAWRSRPRSPGERSSWSATCMSSTTAGSRRCVACRLRCERARSSASRGSTATASRELIDAIAGLRKSDSGTIASADASSRTRPPREMLDAASATSRRSAATRSRARVLDRREHRPARLRRAADAKWGWLFPKKLVERARTLIREFDVRGGGPLTRAGALSGGQPAEGGCGARDRARPEGADRGAAHARARRRRNRVLASATRRGA